MTTKRTAKLGISKNGKTCVVRLREKPCYDPVGNRCAVNVAPFQLGEDILWIHSARLDEALVT
jgi:hypothetical protein